MNQTHTTPIPTYRTNRYGGNAYVAPVAKKDTRPAYHTNNNGSAYLVRPAGS